MRHAQIDDPSWVRERYVEAKELLAEVRDLRARMPADLMEEVDHFHSETFMDTCTTLGADCGCNERAPLGSKTDPDPAQ